MNMTDFIGTDVYHMEAYQYVQKANHWLNKTYGSLPVVAIDALLTMPELAALRDDMNNACKRGDTEATKETARAWMRAIQSKISVGGAEEILQAIEHRKKAEIKWG